MNNYIYVYLDPRKSGRYCYDDVCFIFEPFYIGKGKSGRYLIECGRSDDFFNIINEIKESGLELIVIKLYENLNEKESLKKETKFINDIGRLELKTGYLINKTSGGQGVSGYNHTEETLEKLRKNYQEIKNEFEKRKYKLLTEENEYKNNKQKLNYICPEGHEGSMNWNNFQHGANCFVCSNELIHKKLIKNYKDIKKEFEKRNYILLTEEKDYKNSKDTKLKYVCPEGYEGYINWSNFKQGHGCNCNKKGENNSNCKKMEYEIINIKIDIKNGDLTQREIAIKHGVSRSTIWKIKNEKLWSHIKLGNDL